MKQTLLDSRPDLAAQWHPALNGLLQPGDVAQFSNKKVWWICEKGHSFEQTVSNRVSKRCNCPVCSNHKVLAGYNDIQTTHPKLALEFDRAKNLPFTPENILAGTNRLIWWICVLGHSFRAAGSARIQRGAGCPYCSNKAVLAGFNDLETLNPQAAANWDYEANFPLKPIEVLGGGDKFFHWICDKGHNYKSQMKVRLQQTDCPVCLNRRVEVGFNDFESQRPELLNEWHPTLNLPLLPNSISLGSNKMIWWHCSSGHEWRVRLTSRIYFNSGCPVCSNNRLLPGFNDLATTDPALAKEWDFEKNYPKLPSDVFAKSPVKRWWLCTRGHSWLASSSSRASDSNGCPFCSGHRVIVGETDLPTVAPQLVVEWHESLNGSLLPTGVSGGSNRSVYWQCARGHHWKAAIASRFLKGVGCPYCSNLKAWPGFNDLATTDPEIAQSWHPTKNGERKPEHFTRGADVRIWWLCDEGHSYQSVLFSRTRGSACSRCAKRGFDQTKSGYLYFIRNRELASMKIGIANFDSVRIESWQKSGWELLYKTRKRNGLETISVETEMLRWIRKDLKLPVHLGSAEIGILRGWSETFADGEVADFEVIEMIKTLEPCQGKG
jgi:hypothetical protein